MQSLSFVLAALVISFSLPACCLAPKKKECCGGAACEAPKASGADHTPGKPAAKKKAS